MKSKFHKTLMFSGQAGTFLSFQARRSSAKQSSASDLTVIREQQAAKGGRVRMLDNQSRKIRPDHQPSRYAIEKVHFIS